MVWRVCSRVGCGLTHEGKGMCPTCRRDAERERRPDGNPYATAGHRTFRAAVLARDPRCVCRGDCGREHNGVCASLSTVADHYPHERVDLVSMGLDPNDPQYGRGVCKPCHDGKTSRTRPGGWADGVHA